MVHLAQLIPVFLLFCVAVVVLAKAESRSETAMMQMHRQWMGRFGVSYGSSEEEAMRFNLQGQHLTDDEFSLKYLGRPSSVKQRRSPRPPPPCRRRPPPPKRRRPPPPKRKNPPPPPPSPPGCTKQDFKDWRSLWAGKDVRLQGNCTTCWAFTAVATIEAAWMIKAKPTEPCELSEQQLVDCMTENTCEENKKLPDVFAWVVTNKGITTRAAYPYVETRTNCDKKLAAGSVKIRAFKAVKQKNEVELKKAVSSQPVGVIVDIPLSLRFYKSGVFTRPRNKSTIYSICGFDPYHWMPAVGYGCEEGKKFWILRGSWGEDWGEKGYLRLERDIDDERGLCGIADEPYYPVIG